MAGSGISPQTARLIRGLDAGYEGNRSLDYAAGTPVGRVQPVSFRPVTTHGVQQPGMTPAQAAKLQELMNRRPDAAAFRPLTRPK